MDEHRIGLKPILRGVWAPKGQRPTALGHHRYEWLYVWGFVEPATGATVWNVSNAVCNVRSSSASCGSAPLKELFEGILLDFAKSAGAGANKRIVLQLDGAGWHGPENLAVPDGVRLVFQPSHSPGLQPAEHLWEFVDEPLVNTYFKTIQDLEKLAGERCVALTRQREMIRASTLACWLRARIGVAMWASDEGWPSLMRRAGGTVLPLSFWLAGELGPSAPRLTI